MEKCKNAQIALKKLIDTIESDNIAIKQRIEREERYQEEDDLAESE